MVAAYAGATKAFERSFAGSDGETAPEPAAQAPLPLDAPAPALQRQVGPRQRLRSYRSDQLVAYLQQRGKLPAEVMHDVMIQGWRKLHRDLGCTKLEAWDRWVGLMGSLMPYLHPRMAQVEVKGDGGGGGGGMAALHLLAASALLDRREAPDTPLHQKGVSSQVIDAPSLLDALPTELPTE